MAAPACTFGPVEFIASDANGRLAINHHVTDYLRELRGKKAAVVSIAGEARKGKSYLMNRLMGCNSGFPLGSTINSKTKGIWLAAREHPRDKDRMLILLDTEGLSDPMKGDSTHDARIFTLAILLSSVFVFNSQGSIDQKALDYLQLAAEMTEHIKVKSGAGDEKGTEFAQFFPELIWVLRDFFLELSNEKGELMSPSEYLERCLECEEGFSRKIMSSNALKDALKSFFWNRKCFAFPRPASSNEGMRNLDKLQEKDLDVKFVAASNEFVDYVLGHARNKSIGGQELSVAFFASMAEQYVHLVQNGVACIESAVDAVKKTSNDRAGKEAVARFDNYLASFSLPISPERLRELLLKGHEKAREYYISNAFGISSDHANELMSLLHERSVYIEEKNGNLCRSFCESEIGRVYASLVGRKIDNGEYLRAGGGGIKELGEDVEAFKESYLRNPKIRELWPFSENVLMAFMNDKVQPVLNTVMASDSSLSQKERELEATRQENRRLEEIRQLDRAEQETLRTKIASMEQQRNEDLERIREEQKKEMDAALRQQREQQEKMMEEKERQAKKSYERQEASLHRQMRLMAEKAQEEDRKREEEKKSFEAKMKEQEEQFNKFRNDASRSVEVETDKHLHETMQAGINMLGRFATSPVMGKIVDGVIHAYNKPPADFNRFSRPTMLPFEYPFAERDVYLSSMAYAMQGGNRRYPEEAFGRALLYEGSNDEGQRPPWSRGGAFSLGAERADVFGPRESLPLGGSLYAMGPLGAAIGEMMTMGPPGGDTRGQAPRPGAERKNENPTTDAENAGDGK